MPSHLRNIAIIAHVDHGKTTLVDELLKQTGTLSRQQAPVERIMDSNELERERGITIMAKNTSINWRDHRINIVDTPGHADFGGEVERILSMVDSVLLLVDAVDGPMPQTRFVTQKAFAQGLDPILVVNKVDRDGARPDWVVDQVFDLFDRLGGTDAQMDFPVIYTSAIQGISGMSLNTMAEDMVPLLDLIIDCVPPPTVDLTGPFQMQISALDHSNYVGIIGIGRIARGKAKTNMPVTVVSADGRERNARLLQILGPDGMSRVEVEEASAGDIVAVTGVEGLRISDTLCDPKTLEALPPLIVDEPTVSMIFQVNDSPFAGLEGKFVTSRQLRTRLFKELERNVALRVEETKDPDKFLVAGRGELHLSILIETMRREGYEFAVARPHVIEKIENDKRLEPYEQLSVDVESTHQGTVMTALGERGGEIQSMAPDAKGRVRLEYIIPARGIIGFHALFQTFTSGSGIMTHVFLEYRPVKPLDVGSRSEGVLIANAKGKSSAFALWQLQARGKLLIGPQVDVYEGMIVGVHARQNDLVVNVSRGKQLTNVRASGTDENIVLTPPVKQSLEQALSFINADERVEITPESIRIRKQFLLEHERKRAKRSS